MLRFIPALTVALLLVPVVGGFLGTLLPAFGYFPAIGGHGLSLDPWRHLFGEPGILKAIGLTIATGIAATVLSLGIAIGICAASFDRPWFRHLQAALGPLLALPHAALAVGLAFLLAPSGWIARLLSPWATGWTQPPDLATVQDPAGIALVLGLMAKEVPYLVLMIIAALDQVQARRSMIVARSLGYRPTTAWLKVLLPRLYPQIRLPVYAVLAFSLSVVDMALILGPANPPTLSPLLLRLFTDRDQVMLFPASAGAVFQLALVVVTIALWRIVEIATSATARPSLASGERGGGERLIRAAAMGTGGLAIGLGLLGLVTLVLWSAAGPWRFPDALPDRFDFSVWQYRPAALLAPAWVSLSVALAAVLLALGLAIGCLEAERRHGLKPGRAALLVIYLPLLMPQTAFLFGVQVILIRAGVDGAWLSLVWGHLLFVLPYIFLSLADPWRAFDPRYERIGAGLGVGPWRRLVGLKLPMLLRPLLFAAAIGFAVSITQYLPTLLIGAGRWPSLTTEAVTLASGGDRRLVAALALLQSALPLLAYALAIGLPVLMFRHRRDMQVSR
jgi:putative thiamine transport system permease protein